jgi:PhnB protein
MNIMPYIHFQGNCAEAMTAYAALFKATDLQIMPFSASPDVRESWKGTDLTMHSQFTAEGGAVMMASDYPPEMAGDSQKGFSVMLGPATVARAKELFDALSEGGVVIQPFQANFFSPGFGMLQDRFGTHWIIGAAGA